MSTDLSVRNPTAATLRAADALLRSLGGQMVQLRIPANAAAGSDAEQLGLTTPSFQDVPLSPVIFRRVRAKLSEGGRAQYELLVSASAVNGQLANLQLSSAEALFGSAAGVVVNGAVLLIEAITGAELFGQAYFYRLLLREPQEESL